MHRALCRMLAIAPARCAFDTTTWSRDRKLRAAALSELTDRLIEHAGTIGRTLAREAGKVITQAATEATLTPQTLRHNAGLALAQIGGAAQLAPGVLGTSWREAIGAAGLIVPWNSPIALLVRALGPALAAGCACSPSRAAPRSWFSKTQTLRKWPRS